MSQETMKWLNENITIGFEDSKGPSWWKEPGYDNHFPGPIPVDVVLQRHFGWEALEADVFYENADGKMVGAENAKVVYRSDNGVVLGIHSQKWTMHGYKEWLLDNVGHLMDDTAGSDTLRISSAGLLKRGAVAFVQFETPDTIEGPNGEAFRPFIAATTAMDGTIATTYKAGTTRWVCDNTRAIGLAEAGGSWKVKHTLNSIGRLSDAREALGFVLKVADAYNAEMEALMAQSVSDKQWGAFVEAYVPIEDTLKQRGVTKRENKRMALTSMWNEDPRVAPWAGSAWGVLQAVSTFQLHERGYLHEGKTRVERNWMEFLKGEHAEVESAALKTLATVL